MHDAMVCAQENVLEKLKRHLEHNFNKKIDPHTHVLTKAMYYSIACVVARVHKKEKRVPNCTIPAYKHSLCSTKYTYVCLVLHSDLLLSKQLYKSIVDDLRT